MKKVLLVSVVGMFVLASCKKDRTCECTTSGVTQKSDKYIKVTKKFMVNSVGCVSTESTATNGTVTKTECVIK